MAERKRLPEGKPKPLQHPVAKIVDDYWQSCLVPGISVTAMHRGKLIFSVAYGYRHGPKPARVRPKTAEFTPASPKTYFRIASVSKPVTAVVAMRMVERGELDLDASVKEYLPGFWYRKPGPTIRQLLSHSGGIKAYNGRSNKKRYENCPFSNCRAVVDLLGGDGMVGLPGRQFLYSTHGYTVLGAAMESASGLDFPDLLHRELGSVGSGRPQCEGNFVGGKPVEVSKLWAERKAKGTGHRIHARYMRVPEDDLSWKWPGGGMMATSKGLCRFGMQVADESLLSSRSLDQMWTPQKLWDGTVNRSNYGLGWSITRGRDPVVTHRGGQTGAASYLRIKPDLGLVIAILSNRRGHPVVNLGQSLMRELIKEVRPQPRRPSTKRRTTTSRRPSGVKKRPTSPKARPQPRPRPAARAKPRPKPRQRPRSRK